MQKTRAIPCDTTDMIRNGYSVRLEDLLHTLSGKDPHKMEFGYKYNKTQPLGEDNKTQLLDKGRIFFNHFAQISYTPSATDLLELLYQGYFDWKQSPNWSKSYANIEGIENPYLILLFSLRTANRNVTPRTDPTPDDTRRVSYQFLGLDEIDCLTPNIRSALERLITATPDDLLKLHNEPDERTKQWVKQLNPVFYPRAPEQPTPGVPAASQQPRKHPKTG
ncbi:hypothetical protein PGT21_018556 [Puccinia graminis f. sp. tritici]|uniref:Uncharacterized protein n=1 Tax=Puccinia graminis f. sp. tritici TaxID=56615 RepID=A0A5B0R2J1_PUCGR|nr:hypothetical protein PGT21_018556 [Puccinia graminis f. sp. tritici]